MILFNNDDHDFLLQKYIYLFPVIKRLSCYINLIIIMIILLRIKTG